MSSSLLSPSLTLLGSEAPERWEPEEEWQQRKEWLGPRILFGPRLSKAL